MKIETFEKYIKVTAEKGFFITDYKEGDDILNFSSGIVMITPLNADLSDLREITEEENNRLNDLQIKEIERIKKEKENEQQQ
jgi:hypothetical protein